jgi:hypothetical protein
MKGIPFGKTINGDKGKNNQIDPRQITDLLRANLFNSHLWCGCFSKFEKLLVFLEESRKQNHMVEQ